MPRISRNKRTQLEVAADMIIMLDPDRAMERKDVIDKLSRDELVVNCNRFGDAYIKDVRLDLGFSAPTSSGRHWSKYKIPVEHRIIYELIQAARLRGIEEGKSAAKQQLRDFLGVPSTWDLMNVRLEMSRIEDDLANIDG